MSATIVPIAADVLDRFRAGDEQALEQLFREQFAPLGELAAEEAGEAVVAPRILEDAFADAWETRARFANPEALEGFLRQAVHQRALRQRSRRAAIHRLHEHERSTSHSATEPESVDEAWARLRALLHPAAVDPAQAARIRAAVSRHDTAVHMGVVAHKRNWGTIILVVIISLLVMGGAGVWLRNEARVVRVERAFVGSDVRTLATNPGERAHITLVDGTRADLAADTRLLVPPNFDRVRAVKLDSVGAASFVVAPGLEVPFRVLVGNVKITATGTTIDVSRFPTGDATTIRVRDGSADVEVGESKRSVAGGAVIVVKSDGTFGTPTAEQLEESLGWIDGNFAVIDRPVRVVLPLFDRWYRLRVAVGDSSALDRVATVRAPLDAPREALDLLQSSANVVVQWEDKALVLRDLPAVKGKK